jgi:hypothetical protein
MTPGAARFRPPCRCGHPSYSHWRVLRHGLLFTANGACAACSSCRTYWAQWFWVAGRRVWSWSPGYC